jgi:signal transduction histidine kinase
MSSSTRRGLLVALIVVPAVADLLAATASPSGFWSEFLPALYYAGIVIAGLQFGWKAGLSVALLSGICHTVIGRVVLASPVVRLEASVLAFLVVGFAFLEDRRRSAAQIQTPKPAPSPLGSPQGKQYVEQVSSMASELLREIRTPFASIEGAAYILEEGGADNPENRREFVEIIRSECRRVNRVLSDIEACTELIPLKCTPTDAATVLGEVMRLSALGHPDPAVSLRIEIASDLPPLWCDAIRVEQTMVPFVTSAMSGMTSGGEILLSAAREGNQARIQLRTLGQTIQGGDPFSGRGQYSSTFEADSGIRVLAARRTILQHGGTIAVEENGYIKRLSSLTLPLYNGSLP